MSPEIPNIADFSAGKTIESVVFVPRNDSRFKSTPKVTVDELTDADGNVSVLGLEGKVIYVPASSIPDGTLPMVKATLDPKSDLAQFINQKLYDSNKEFRRIIDSATEVR